MQSVFQSRCRDFSIWLTCLLICRKTKAILIATQACPCEACFSAAGPLTRQSVFKSTSPVRWTVARSFIQMGETNCFAWSHDIPLWEASQWWTEPCVIRLCKNVLNWFRLVWFVKRNGGRRGDFKRAGQLYSCAKTVKLCFWSMVSYSPHTENSTHMKIHCPPVLSDCTSLFLAIKAKLWASPFIFGSHLVPVCYHLSVASVTRSIVKLFIP